MTEGSAHSSKKWEAFRQAAEWISGAFVVLHLVAAVWDAWKEQEKLAEILHPKAILALAGSHKFQAAVVVLAAIIWALARFPRLRFAISRGLFGRTRTATGETPLLFRGLQPYRTGEQLPGRRVDGERCCLLLGEQAFLVLEGESGCGKSSLLNAILIPKAQELFRTVRVRLADEPYVATIRALEGLDGAKTSWSADAQGLSKAISDLAARRKGPDHESGEREKPLLLCIDQFEELFGSVSDQVRREYMEVLRKAIVADELRLLIVTRIDFSDLLVNLCREVDPSGAAFAVEHFYVLKPFRKEQALWVLQEIFAPVISSDEELAAEFGSFEETLVGDLLQPPRDRRLSRDDEKTVLPAELQMVGQMIESLGADQFTSRSFKEHGGRNGLLNLYVEQAKDSVARMGVPGDKALLILRQLVPKGRTRVASSAQTISETLGLPLPQVTRALEAFTELRLVNPVPKASDEQAGDHGGMRYELMHEHLAQVLRDAGDPALQQAREAEESLRFWRERALPVDVGAQSSTGSRLWAHVKNALAQPIPIFEAFFLLRRVNRPDRAILFASIRAFFLRFALVAVPAVLFILWMQSDAYQVREVISKGTSLNLDPAAIMDVMGTAVPQYQSAEATSSVIDDWIEALHISRNENRGRKQLEASLDQLNQRAETKNSALYAGVILHLEEGKILSWRGENDQAATHFDAAQKILDRICVNQAAYDNSGLCFVGEARLADAESSTAKTPDQLDRAVRTWRSALDFANGAVIYTVPVDVGQFVLSVRNIDRLQGADAKVREQLWNEAVEIISKDYSPPYNCIALSEIAYEFHKEGNTERADALWKLAEETAANFVPLPPLPPLSANTSGASAKASFTPRDPSRFRGLLNEAYDNLAFDRCKVWLYLGSTQYRAGEKEAAVESWRRYLTQVRDVRPVPAPSYPPVSGDTTPQKAPPNPYLNEPSALPNLGEFGRVMYALRRPPPPSKVNTDLDAIAKQGEAEIVELANQRTGPCPQCVVELVASALRLWGLDDGASQRTWETSLTAAKELKGPRGLAVQPVPPGVGRDKIQSNTQDGELLEMESALPQNVEVELKAQIFPFVSLLLLEQGKLTESLNAANAITAEQARQWSLEEAAQLLIYKGDIQGAKKVVSNVTDETARTGDDRMRPVWINSAVTLQAQLGQFRQARKLCEMGGQTSVGGQLSCLVTILENYEARNKESLRAQFREQDDRESLDWWGAGPRY